MTVLSVADAAGVIQSSLGLLATQQVALRELNGCVLAEPIVMERDQPPFDRVTMDGIAIRASAMQLTRRFRIAGTQAAGAKPLQLESDSDCIEVMTGAALPLGCDCVIPVERLQRDANHVSVDETLQCMPWLNVHRRGSDARGGDVLLKPVNT